ncbi:MAG: hypothetical protein CMH79_02385 [Nitrospinae bacterium]|nr:hypothetical protein [Nitrospinota bacterium]
MQLSYRSNKTKKIFLLITFIFSSFFLLNNEKLAIGNTLNKYLWKNRIVLIFSKNHKHSLFLKQKREFSNLKSEIAERDLIFIHVFNNSNSKNKFLKNKYNSESSDFKILLLGKDGGIKLESFELITHEKIFSLIDSMPMRQMEMMN